MKKYSKHNSAIFTLFASLTLFVPILLVSPNAVMAVDNGGPIKAKVKDVAKLETGVVSVKNGYTWSTLHRLERVGENNEIETGKGGWVELKLLDKKDKVKLGKNSYLIISEMKEGEKNKKCTLSKTALTRGKVRVKFDENSDSIMTVNTTNAVVKIEKADCIVQYDASSETTTVTVNVTFKGGYALVTPVKATIDYGIMVPEKNKIEIKGKEKKFIIDTAGNELDLFSGDMKFADEKTVAEFTINDKIAVMEINDDSNITRTKTKGDGEITFTGKVKAGVKCVVIAGMSDDPETVMVEDDNRWSHTFSAKIDKEYNLAIGKCGDSTKKSRGRGVSLKMIPMMDVTLRESKVTKHGDETKKIEKVENLKVEKSNVDANREARDFVKKFVSYLNSESTSGIRRMVSSSYSGNIGGFGSKNALLRSLDDYFDNNKSARISYSVSNASSLSDEAIILNATINGNSVKFWIKKDGSNYRLGHAEGKWFFD